MIPRTPFTLLMGAFLVAAVGCGPGEGEGSRSRGDNNEGAPIPAVEVVQARHGSLPLRERVTGVLQALGQVAIYPQVDGPIVEVLVQNGEAVEKGAPLVRIQPATSNSRLAQSQAGLSAMRADVERAEAALGELETRFARTQQLAKDALVSAEAVETQRAQLQAAGAELSQAKARVAEAEAALSESREALQQTVVRAPISGRIGRKDAEVGMMVGPQTRLFTMGKLEQMRAVVPITQKMLGLLEIGQRVEVSAENLDDTLIQARISRISPFLTEGSFSAEAEIDISNESGVLIPGMFVTVDIFYGESRMATLVPRSALHEHPGTGLTGVYVIPDSSSLGFAVGENGGRGVPPSPDTIATVFRPVTEAADGGPVAGIDGVEDGSWVVVVGQHLLSSQVETEQPLAKVRAVSWERVIGLQTLQREDLLRQFMAKQQRLARRQVPGAGHLDSIGDTTATLPTEM